MSAALFLGIVIGVALTFIIIWGYYGLVAIQKNPNIPLNLWHKKNNITPFQALRNCKDASPELQKKLIEMLNGDQKEAERLVARARFGRHGKSEAYYWWKAIQELEYKRKKNKQ